MNSPYSYKGKTVLITGGTSGIGRAVAVAFAEAGANLVLVGRNHSAGEVTLEALRARGAEAEFVQGSVADEAVVKNAVERALQRFGRLDVAVNNAGVLDSELKPIHLKSGDEYETVFGINVKGMFYSLKHELAAMLPQRSGVIVNMSSVAGGRGGAMMSLYVASKHAVEGLTKCAALEAAPHGVRVLMVRPHAVETPMIDQLVGPGDSAAREGLKTTVPLGRLGRPEEQARALLFLCSADASYITGSPICIDGGFHAA